MGNCLGKKSIERKKQLKQSSSRLVKSSCRLSTNDSLISTKIDVVKDSFVILNHDECQIDIIDEPLNLSPIDTDEKFVLTPSFNSHDWKSTLHDVDTIKADDTLQESIESIGEISDSGFEKPVLTSENNDDDQEVPSSPSTLQTESLSNSPRSSSFSSIEHLIVLSSSSSDDVPCSPLSSSVDRHRCQTLLNYSEQISLNPSSSSFPFVLPVKSSFQQFDEQFFHQFHQHLLCHPCQTLRTIVDNMIEEETIRIHRRSQTILIEHEQMSCIDHHETLKNDRSSWFIFDSNERIVQLTKYAPYKAIQSIVDERSDRSTRILSSTKLFEILRPFLHVNITHEFVQRMINDSNWKDRFGFVSSWKSNRIEQISINKSKLNYSKDLDVETTSFSFVLRLSSWPKEIRSFFEQRSRHWPEHIDDLFDQTCFIRLNDSPRHSWSFSYAAIEARLVSMMSIEQRRFASILWNYFNGKCQGKLSFRLFKHSLFYFFETYSFNDFSTCDLLRFIDHFIRFFVEYSSNEFARHYFNSNEEIFVDHRTIIEYFSTTSPTNYFDLKTRSICHRSSSYLYRLIYLIEFQSDLLESLLSSKCNPIQTTLVNLDQSVKKQLSMGIRISSSHQVFQRENCSYSLTLDDLYRYQDENVHLIFNYLSLLRRKEASILVHSLWSMFIQYFNTFFDDLFVDDDDHQSSSSSV